MLRATFEHHLVSHGFVLSPQLHPKTYVPSPVLFPFSARSCGILGASAVHRITGNREILSRIVPEECCWFAGQTRRGGARTNNFVVSNDVEFETILAERNNMLSYENLKRFSKCTAFVDCSHRATDKEWFPRNGPLVHPSVQALLRQKDNYESFGNGRGNENYIVINAGSSNSNDGPMEDEVENETGKQTNRKLEEEDSPKRSNVFPAKQDDNI
ncbi:uncharacterized protein LOC116428755 [Nomia melanderi]|uniref:uncharacterized protein LOC116428755 n=1 Tax=Nomia melanderi TaxID=2448451 RepID=UPI0013045B84|nr:uncharacterized protein LOC116428755 [Nomia melanderi]